MAMPTSPIFKRSNEDILNVIRGNSSPDYQRHVPVATQANLHETFRAITSTPDYRNEFEHAFVNKIARQVVRSIAWNNPLAKFKGPSLEYGATIEEVQVGLLNAYAHDDGADYGDESIWSREFPRVDVAYHTLNRYDVYKITIPEQALRGAFLTEGGLSTFAAQLMAAPNTSDARDEYLVMRNLFKQYGEADGYYDIQVPDITRIESSENDAKRTLRTVRALGGQLQFLSDKYNAAHMPSAVQPDDLELFITPQANAALDVDALAGMFNVDRGEIGTRTTMIDEFPDDPGTIAILTSRDFFVVADQIYQTASIKNPANLTEQHFLHHKQVVSASRFVPAIRLTSNPVREKITVQDVSTVTLSPLAVSDVNGDTVTTVQRGSSYRVSGFGLAEGGVFQTGTVLAIEGGVSDVTLVTQMGTLYIGPDETAETLTLRQTAIDTELTSTLTLEVDGPILHLWPSPQVLDDADGDELYEVTPEAPTENDGVITIPNIRGVQYQAGDGTTQANVVNGSTVDAPTTITAVARSGFELAAGAVTSWTFTA